MSLFLLAPDVKRLLSCSAQPRNAAIDAAAAGADAVVTWTLVAAHTALGRVSVRLRPVRQRQTGGTAAAAARRSRRLRRYWIVDG
jgi:hypothetical protein